MFFNYYVWSLLISSLNFKIGSSVKSNECQAVNFQTIDTRFLTIDQNKILSINDQLKSKTADNARLVTIKPKALWIIHFLYYMLPIIDHAQQNWIFA